MKDKIDILAKHLRDIECVHKSTHSPEKMAVRIINKLDSLYKAEQRERYEKAADYFDKTFEQKIRWPYDRMCEIASGIDKQKEER